MSIIHVYLHVYAYSFIHIFKHNPLVKPTAVLVIIRLISEFIS